jgi:hypothetical protein
VSLPLLPYSVCGNVQAEAKIIPLTSRTARSVGILRLVVARLLPILKVRTIFGNIVFIIMRISHWNDLFVASK